MKTKSLLLTFTLGMFLAASCFAWFLHGLAEGGGEVPMAGMAIGVALMIWTLVVGLFNAIKHHRKQSRLD